VGVSFKSHIQPWETRVSGTVTASSTIHTDISAFRMNRQTGPVLSGGSLSRFTSAFSDVQMRKASNSNHKPKILAMEP